jgi:hypothetical protein
VKYISGREALLRHLVPIRHQELRLAVFTEVGHDIDGGIFGGHFGYNVQAGSFVVGLEASIGRNEYQRPNR